MKIKTIAQAALIGAVYTLLTLLFAPISYGPVQFRISEALTILPFLFPMSSWGLFIGCALANILGGNGLPDIIFGSLATLAAGLLTARIKLRWLAPLPPVVINAFVVGAVLSVTVPEAPDAAFFLFSAQVGFGQLVVCFGLGLPLLFAVEKLGLFKSPGRGL